MRLRVSTKDAGVGGSVRRSAGRIVAALAWLVCSMAGCNVGVATASEALPDARVWEMVSPLDKNGGEIAGIDGVSEGGLVQAAPSGNAITYVSINAFGAAQGAPVGGQYLSKLTASGWDVTNITTSMTSGGASLVGEGTAYKAFSPNLEEGLLRPETRRPTESPPLSAEAPEGYLNYYLRANNNVLFRPLLSFVPQREVGVVELPTEFEMQLEWVTPDLRIVFVKSVARLTGDAKFTGLKNLYEWSNGSFHLVNIAPDGTQVPENSRVGAGASGASHAVSQDGTKVFWTDGSNLYVRENGAFTRQVDKSEVVGGESGDGTFRDAAIDGAKAFFLDERRLTADASAADGGRDLYEYNLSTDHVSNLTVDEHGGDARGADVQGVLGVSDDGSYVYFVARGVLDSGELGTSGQENLYLWHGGQVRFIGALAATDEKDWGVVLPERTTRVSRDGQRLLFISDASLTGYDNRDRRTGLPDEEVYLYKASASHLSCVSCDPTGRRPSGSASIPAADRAEAIYGTYESRVMSENGERIFFDSSDALVPGDTNGAKDVYEYEQGQLHLISGGEGRGGAEFVDASVDGDNVFFVTDQQLSPSDTDEQVDLYDARVNGFAPREAPGLAPCAGDSCRSGASPQPSFDIPGSVSFTGGGNLAQAAVVKKLVAAKGNGSKVKKRKARAKRRKAKRAGARVARGRRTHGKTRSRGVPSSTAKGRG